MAGTVELALGADPAVDPTTLTWTDITSYVQTQPDGGDPDDYVETNPWPGPRVTKE